MRSDAKSTVWGWCQGTKNVPMNAILKPQVVALHEKGIFLQTEHVPGLENRRADYLSRNIDPQDYELLPSVFQAMIRRLAVTPTLDAFANRRNAKCRKFCSRRLDTRAVGEAFTTSWMGETVWLNPPWELALRALQKAAEERVPVAFCLPRWPAASWWPLLLEAADVIYEAPRAPLYRDKTGQLMPEPKWRTVYGTLYCRGP